jgi:hypothetical protein
MAVVVPGGGVGGAAAGAEPDLVLAWQGDQRVAAGGGGDRADVGDRLVVVEQVELRLGRDSGHALAADALAGPGADGAVDRAVGVHASAGRAFGCECRAWRESGRVAVLAVAEQDSMTRAGGRSLSGWDQRGQQACGQ